MRLLAWLSACVSFVLKGPTLGLARLGAQFRRPYRGPCIVLDILEAKLEKESNSRLDWSSPFGVISTGEPDLRVEWRHGSSWGETHVESCTYKPSWCCSRKIPYRPDEGISFKVVDVDMLSRNEVAGRCFCSKDKIRDAMKKKTPIVMSLGNGWAPQSHPVDHASVWHASGVRVLNTDGAPYMLCTLRTGSECSRLR